jgi:hypothetical protein
MFTITGQGAPEGNAPSTQSDDCVAHCSCSGQEKKRLLMTYSAGIAFRVTHYTCNRIGAQRNAPRVTTS